MRLDFVGDIHGHASYLLTLLERLGYKKQQRGWKQPNATLVFLGDLIDRGPEQKQTVEIVRELCELGIAICLSGNHEFNAVGFVIKRTDDPGQYIRSHTTNHLKQHEIFLEAYANDRFGYEETIAWFAKLPIWFEMADVRAVHACWHEPAKEELAEFLDVNHCPKDRSFFEQTGIKGSTAWTARETLLNGLELPLPGDTTFNDYYGIKRRRIRVNWWTPSQTTYRSAAVIDGSQRARIPNIKLLEPAPTYEEQLCFFGHYWMRGIPRIEHSRAVCLDYSIALDDGALCAYSFKGEKDANPNHLTWVQK